VIGEGGSGGALALAVADRILMLEHAIYSVISPEGCAAILYHDASRAEEVSSQLKLTSHDAKLLGVVDFVIAEPDGGAHVNVDATARQLRDRVLRELVALQRITPAELVKNRYKKFRKIGQFNSLYGWWFDQIKDRFPKRYRHEGEKQPQIESTTSEEA
jgi:acetyl-CoA carboxylase alpha subunit